MKDRSIQVVTQDGVLYLVRCPGEPLGGRCYDWSRYNPDMSPAGEDFPDGRDDPHVAGNVVVRRDNRGWYVDRDMCVDCREYPQDDLSRQAPERWFFDELAGDCGEYELIHLCRWCKGDRMMGL